MMLWGIIIGRLILGQGAAPMDFNVFAQYGLPGIFIMYLIYREYKSDEEKAAMQKYMNEDRRELLTKLDKATTTIERLEKKLEQ